MATDKIPLIVRHTMSEIQPVGSRVTCDPAPTNTDEDFLVSIAPWKIRDTANQLSEDGWKLDGSEASDDTGRIKDKFLSYKKDDINLILTCDKTFFDRFMAATSCAKRFNLLEKADRVALFQAVLYGNASIDPEDAIMEVYEA
jgi:hypothetical protein